MSVGSIAAKGRRTGKSPWVERLGRAGLVAKGVLYGVVGILALKVAFGADEENADREGALRTIAAQPFGRGLLSSSLSALPATPCGASRRAFSTGTTRARASRGSRSAVARSHGPRGTAPSAR